MKHMTDKLLSLRKVGCEVVIAQWSRQIAKLAITRHEIPRQFQYFFIVFTGMCVQPILIIVNMLYEQITTSENIPPQ